MESPQSQNHSVSSFARFSNRLGPRLPNILTLCRILIIPIFVVLLIDPTPKMNLWATFVFVVASITDWLDGFLARLYQAESILGKLLDPLADKVLVMSALVMLAASPGQPRVPAWIVVALLARELLVSGLRSVAAVKGTVVAASDSAKHKTAWTMIGITFLLIGEPYYVLGTLVDFHSAGMVFLWIALILSVGSGIAYAVDLRKMFV